MRSLLFLCCLLALPLPATAWTEPPRGSQTRADLLDALRPHAEWLLGKPMQFVVHDLRIDGQIAFANVTAQHPGGRAVDLANSPGALDGLFDPDIMGSADFQALYVKSGNMWVAQHWAFGAQDVWYATPDFCAGFWVVIPEICATR